MKIILTLVFISISFLVRAQVTKGLTACVIIQKNDTVEVMMAVWPSLNEAQKISIIKGYRLIFEDQREDVFCDKYYRVINKKKLIAFKLLTDD